MKRCRSKFMFAAVWLNCMLLTAGCGTETGDGADELRIVTIDTDPELFVYVESITQYTSLDSYSSGTGVRTGAVIEYVTNQVTEPYILQMPEYYGEEPVCYSEVITGDEYVTEVHFPNTYYSGGVEDCAALKRIEYGNEMGNPYFSDCPMLTDVLWPTTSRFASYKAGSNCDSLEKLELPQTVYTLYGAFCNNDSLTEVELPPYIMAISGSFIGCGSLKTVTIPSGNVRIDGGSFTDCGNLVLLVQQGSDAEQYAIENGISYRYK